MNIFATYQHLIGFELERMVSAGDLPALDITRVTVEQPRDAAFGDLVTNAALIASGKGESDKMAQILAKHFVSLHDVIKAEAAANGLVNLYLKPVVWHRALSGILHGTSGNDPCQGIVFDSARDFTASDAVFNIQYSRTMCCAVLRHAQTALSGDLGDDALAAANFALLTGEAELALARLLIAWPQMELRGRDAYGQTLANAFRALCAVQTGTAAMGFVTVTDNAATMARLALVRCTAIVLADVAS